MYSIEIIMDVREIKFNYLDNNENETDILYNKNNQMGKKNVTNVLLIYKLKTNQYKWNSIQIQL